MDIQDKLFQAIDIIAEQKLSSLPFNNCIEGVIASSTPNIDGSYNFLYKDLTLTAFPMGSVACKEGDVVYIMLIGNDINKEKVIVAAKNSSENIYMDVGTRLLNLDKSGRNYVWGGSQFVLPSGTSSVNLDMSPDYLGDSFSQTHILIAAGIESNLQPTVDAIYGITIKLKYEDDIEREYTLGLNEVLGNPYHQIGGNQYVIESLYLGAAPVQILEAKLFISGFPTDSNTVPIEYVKFTNVRIEYAQQALADVANDVTYRVEINSKYGNVFKNGDVSTELSATVYRGSNNVTYNIDASRFIWTRSSSNAAADEEWNLAHATGMKTITITIADVQEQATFSCSISEV